jgi:hypothetical protein
MIACTLLTLLLPGCAASTAKIADPTSIPRPALWGAEAIGQIGSRRQVGELDGEYSRRRFRCATAWGDFQKQWFPKFKKRSVTSTRARSPPLGRKNFMIR